MKRTTYFSILLLSIGFGIRAQDLQKRIFGTVIDAYTKEAIPFVHVVSAGNGTVTNLNGLFDIQAPENDTIYFSHVNYRTDFIPLKAIVGDTLKLYLSPIDILLNEVIIHEFPSEDQFKKQLLELQITLTKQQANADQNLANAQALYQSGYAPILDSKDNYKQYIRGPQGVSILSSDPSKGLIKAFRNMSGDNNFVFYPSSSQTVGMDSTLLNFKLKRDTTSRKSTLND